MPVENAIVKDNFTNIKLPSTQKMTSSRSPFVSIILEGADTDAAVEVSENHVFTSSESALKVIFVQDALEDELNAKIAKKFQSSVKNNADLEDLSSVCEDLKEKGSKVILIRSPADSKPRAVIISGGKPMKANKPIIFIIPFRTATEAVKLFNNLGNLEGASIWGADFSLIIATAKKLNAVDVSINCHLEKYRPVPDIVDPFLSKDTPTIETLVQLQKLAKEVNLRKLTDIGEAFVVVPKNRNVLIGRQMNCGPRISYWEEDSQDQILLSLALGYQVVIKTVTSLREQVRNFQREIENILPDSVTVEFIDNLNYGPLKSDINQKLIENLSDFQFIYLP